MIRATIVPYLHGWAGVCIAEGDQPPFHCLAAESFEVGTVPGRPSDGSFVPGLKREVTADALSHLAIKVIQMLSAHAVEHVTIERHVETRRRGQVATGHAVAVASAIAARLEEKRMAYEVVDAAWRRSLGGTIGEHAGRSESVVRRGFENWPEPIERPDGTVIRGEAQMLAGSLLIHEVLEGVLPVGVAPVPAPTQKDPVASAAAGATDSAAVVGADVYTRIPDPSPGVPRVAGCDPGSSALTLAVGEGTEAPFTFLGFRSFELGHADPTYEQIGELAVDAVQWLRTWGVKRLALEHVASVYFLGANMSTAAAIATDQMRTARMATALAIAALAVGIEIVPVMAATWRARVVGKSNPKDATIAPIVVAHFRTFPSISTAHVRDASGVCAFALLPPKEPASKKKPKGASSKAAKPKSPKPAGAETGKTWIQLTKEEREIAKAKDLVLRKEVGCTCATRGRHRRDCKLAGSTHNKGGGAHA